MDRLNDQLDRLASGELDGSKADQRRGVTHKALIRMPPKDVLCPPLHANELFVNTPIKAFMLWVNHRIKRLPEELIIARVEHIDLCLEQEATAEELAEALVTVRFYEDEAKAIRPPIKRRNAGELVYRDEKHKSDWLENADVLEVVKDVANAVKKEHADLNRKTRSAEQKATSIEKLTEKSMEHCRNTSVNALNK